MAARILVVEDDESMRELLRLHLEHAGYEVAVANDGIVAGYEVLKTPPDLIMEEGGARATQLGAADYILKPVMVDRLMESVKKALR